jgi:hypothetical protein
VAVQAGWDWQAAIFGQNEAGTIGRCVRAIAAAAQGRRVLATIILNGTTDDSARVAQEAALACRLPTDIHTIAHADKSNAINHAFRGLRADARHHAYIDAYATIGSGTFAAFEAALSSNAKAVALSGIGFGGRTMPMVNREVLKTGGVLRGQLHCLRAGFIDRLVAHNLLLPVGLYRGDGLLGSMAAHDLDAMGQKWDNARIAGAPGAEFSIEPLSALSARDVRRQFRRMVRQMRGRLENEAIKEIIYTEGFAALPYSADSMIGGWLSRHGAPRVPIPEKPFLALALRQVRLARKVDAARLAPILVTRIRP